MINIFLLDKDPKECAKMYPDGLILKAQREIICTINPSDYAKTLHKYLGFEYKKRFGKISRYSISWEDCDKENWPNIDIFVESERLRLYDLVKKGLRIEWSSDIPEWWIRQENKGRLFCRYIKKRNLKYSEEKNRNEKSDLRIILEYNKKISEDNKTKKISEKILTQKYLDGENCFSLIDLNLINQLEEKEIQKIKELIKKESPDKKTPNRKIIKKWINSGNLELEIKKYNQNKVKSI